ncbi:MAG: hypothetical protein AB4041_09760 [Microcystaceae cyanobacterium]
MMNLPPSQQPPDSQLNNLICVLLTVALLGLTFWVNSIARYSIFLDSSSVIYLSNF